VDQVEIGCRGGIPFSGTGRWLGGALAKLREDRRFHGEQRVPLRLPLIL